MMFTKMKTNKMSHNKQDKFNTSMLLENLETGDLERLVSNKITVDEYKSKLGSDEEIVVLAFQIYGKEPAVDLVNFVEKSYEWVIDADVSSGEVGDGNFIVFIEVERDPTIVDQILELLSDLKNVTEHNVDDWIVEYYKPRKILEPTRESLAAGIPTTPSEYNRLIKSQKDEIDKLKTAAGVRVDTTAPKNDFTESLRVMAGIR